MKEKIKIVIADDHALVRQSLAKALDIHPNFKVLGQAENGQVLTKMAVNLNPDVIIVDLQMPVSSGWEALEYLKVNCPCCRTIVLSMHFENILIKDLIERGARGFLPKNSDFEALINAIEEVHKNGYFFSRTISEAIVKELLMSRKTVSVSGHSKLTEKETDTLLLICKDKLTKEIASIMSVSERTIERYKTCLYEKTKSKTTAGLVLYALRNNLIQA